MNLINCLAPNVWVFIAQLVEHCSANTKARGSILVKAKKFFFSSLTRNCLGCVSLGQSENGFVIPDHMDSSTPKKPQNPKKDYFVMTRQTGGTQYISERYFSRTALEFN